MLRNSNEFFKSFNKDVREELSVRVTINDVVYGNEDIFSLSYDAGSMTGDQLAIGSSYSNSVKITFCDTITTLKELDKVVVELGIKREMLDTKIIGGNISKVGYASVGYGPINNYTTEGNKENFDVRGRFAKAGKMYMNRWNAQEEYEYSRMGEFYISEQIDVNWNEKTTSLECSDALIFTESPYTTELRYPAQLRDIVKEAGKNVGLTLDYLNYDHLPDMVLEKLTGDLTNRQALEVFSQFIIGYVCINRYGYLELKTFVHTDYEVNPNYYYSKGLTKNEISYIVGGITCVIDTEQDEPIEIHAGSYYGTQMKISNNLMTQELLDVMYAKLSTIDYSPYSLSWRGMPALEVGDYMIVTDTNDNFYTVPNMSYTLDFNGGLKATSAANTVSVTNIISSDRSPLLGDITKTVNEVKIVNATVSQKVAIVNETVTELNRSIELADLQGIKVSVNGLLEVTESVVKDVGTLTSKLSDSAIEKLHEDFHVLQLLFDELNKVVDGTEWMQLTSEFTDVLYPARYKRIDKIVKLQFSLTGFTSEDSIAVFLPEDNRSQRLIYRPLITLEGKTALVSINPDGSVKIAKVFGVGIESTDVFTLDVEFPID